MDSKITYLSKIFLVTILSFSLVGCAVNFKKTPPEEVKRAKEWKQQATELSAEVEDLKRIKASLEKRLKKELEGKDVRVEMDKRGLVITLLDKILFDSGKAELKPESFKILDKVIKSLRADLGNNKIGIEGHTDNRPIKHSKWKSNWELSTARALSVLHYFEGKKGIKPELLSAVGYGPYRPIVSNKTVEGREQNRRVEIVILPEVAKAKKQPAKSYKGIK